MKSSDDRLKDCIENQEKILDDLKDILRDSARDKKQKTLENLESEITVLKEQNDVLQTRVSELEKKDVEQNLALLDLGSSEKMKILTLSRKSRELYFRQKAKGNISSLADFENNINKKIHTFQRQLFREQIQKQQDLKQKTDALFDQIRDILKKNRDEQAEKEKEFFDDINRDYSYLEKEPVTQEQIDRRTKRNRLEMKIGMQILNKLGIALVLISIGFLAYYSKNSYLQAALIFLYGGIFLLFGEIFERKGKQAFSRTLMGGAVGILYSGVFFSHFVLKSGNGTALVSQNIALLMVVGITAFTLLLSWIRKSEIIQIIGLAGGFLPFLSFLITTGFAGSFVYLGMAYLFLINLAVLVLSFFKKWRLTGIISFILHTPAMIYLAFRSENKIISLIYIFIVYLFYLAAVLIPRLRLNRKMNIWDVLFMGANSLCMGILSFTLFSQLGWKTFWSIPALALTVFFFFLARRLQAKGKNQDGEFFLFMGMSLFFSLWMIPVLFGLKGLIIGFLLEALILITLGHKKNLPYIEKAGWIAFFSLSAALLFRLFLFICQGVDIEPDFMRPLFHWIAQDGVKLVHENLILYAAGSIGIIIVYTPWLNQHFEDASRKSRRLILFRNLALVLVFGTVSVESIVLLLNLADRYPSLDKILFGYDYDLIGYAVFGSLSVISSLYAMGLSLLKKWKDSAIVLFRNIAFCAGFLFFMVCLPQMGNTMDYLDYETLGHFPRALILGTEILYALAQLWAFWRIFSSIIIRKKGSLGAFPIIYGLIILVYLSYFLFLRIVTPPAVVVGFCFLSAAIAYIFWGFRKYYPPLRILGLITLFLALLILLIPIVRQATILVIIISFLVYGLLLLGISFLYHHISQKRNKNED